MIAKDRLYLGIKQGHFGTVENATKYANEYSLNIELRTIGRENLVQFRFVKSSDWFLPLQWKDNYERKLKIAHEAAIERFTSLGFSTGKQEDSVVMFDLNRWTHKDMVQFVQLIVDSVKRSQNVVGKVKNGNVEYSIDELGTQFRERWKHLLPKQQ